MLVKAEAVALQIRPWSKTSHIVTWLTADHGCVTTSVKGACRPKSAFLGQYDLFYTCELLFYRREHNGVHAIRECAPLQRRDALRGNWRAAAAAVYAADLTTRAIRGGPHPEVFAHLTRTLDQLCQCSNPPSPLPSFPSPLPIILRYEMHLLHRLGLLPDLAPCPLCPPAQQGWHRFSLPAGRVLCAHRPEPRPGEAVISLHHTVRACFAALKNEMLQAPPSPPAVPPPGNKNEKKLKLPLGFSRFLGIFISFHLDAPATVRRMAMEMMGQDTGAHECATGEWIT